jgi:hypothetical protein
MATKRETGSPVESGADETADPKDISSKPRMIIAAGRGKVGKSVLWTLPITGQ